MPDATLELVRPQAPAELDDVRSLFRQFIEWHRRTHVEDLALIERYFDREAFEAELAALPGDYAQPRGDLLLARVGLEAAGCVALHDLGDGDCEMKRMFVPDRFRGRGVGLSLGTAIVEAGKTLGYRAMRLDTSHRQGAAIRLYKRLGFRRIDSYSELPQELRDWLVFFELRL